MILMVVNPMAVQRNNPPQANMGNQAQSQGERPKLGIAAMIKEFDKKTKDSINQFNIPKIPIE